MFFNKKNQDFFAQTLRTKGLAEKNLDCLIEKRDFVLFSFNFQIKIHKLQIQSDKSGIPAAGKLSSRPPKFLSFPPHTQTKIQI